MMVATAEYIAVVYVSTESIAAKASTTIAEAIVLPTSVPIPVIKIFIYSFLFFLSSFFPLLFYG